MTASVSTNSGKLRNPSTPAVSVIIPAYNTAKYIAVTLQSALSQTFTNFEVIVINDGSPDSNDLEIAIQPFLERIVYLKQENRGPGSARNLGIIQARGQFVAFLDSDDIWLPEYLHKQMKLFEGTPSLDMVYSDALLCSLDGSSRKTYMETCPSSSPVTFESLLVEDSQVITSGTVARRWKIVEAGLFDESKALIGSEDYDLWLRVAYHGGVIAFQRQVLLKHLVRPNSLSSDGVRILENIIKVLTGLERNLQLSPERIALLRNKLAQTEAQLALERGKQYLLLGELDKAGASLLRANEFVRGLKLSAVLLGLRIAPRLTAFGVRCWDRFLALSN
jgi:glycosyltransferase involved in cell wall biosynthesis